ncbi:MAG TPA: AAA family ATPase [Acidimicrobiales bacterium]|nr:AAA family ATPase [Acidimicrobiales bacterium]
MVGIWVVSISGVQCTGKTTLARALAQRMGATLVSRDPLMAVLLGGGLPAGGLKRPPVAPVPELGYGLQSAVLRQQLDVGRSVVVECIAEPSVRDGWRRIAEEHGAGFAAVETTCSDPEMHRSRFEDRGTAPVGDWHLHWQNVERTKRRYRPHPDTCFVADSIHPLADNVAAIARVLRL